MVGQGERFLPDQGDVTATGLAAQRMQAEGFVVLRDHSAEALHEGEQDPCGRLVAGLR